MEKAYEDGVRGFGSNSSSPYLSQGAHGVRHKEWERGYNAAYFLNLRRVKSREESYQEDKHYA